MTESGSAPTGRPRRAARSSADQAAPSPRRAASPDGPDEPRALPKRVVPEDEILIETRMLPAINPDADPSPETKGESLVDQIDQQDRKNLGRNSLLMASGTLVSRVLGMVNASLQMAVLGQAVVGDAFKSANTLPNFILVLLSGGILNAVLIPQITKAMKREDGGKDFVDRLVTLALLLIVIIAAICTVGAGVFIQAFTSFSGPALQLATAFAFLCMPQVLFYGIFAVLGNILNARGRFGAYGWAPVANNLVAITGEVIFLVLWGRQEDPTTWSAEMIWVLAGTATLGIAVQALILIPALARSGFRWTPRFGWRGYGFGQVGRFASLTFTALVIAQFGGLVVMRVATYLVDAPAPGQVYVPGYSAYQNALSLFQLPYSLIAVSLLTALFPQLARAWQRRDDPDVGTTDMQELLRRGLTLTAVGIIPASAVLIALAAPTVKVVYFSVAAEQSDATALLLMVMAASTMAYTVVTLQQQYCFASEQGGTNLWMQILVTAVQVGFAFAALTVPVEYGMLVVCAGMFFGNGLLAVVFLFYARHQIGGYGLRGIGRLYLKLALAGLIGGLAAWGVKVLVLGQSDAASWLWQFGALAGGGVVFVLVFLVVARLLRIGEFFDLINPILRRLHLPAVS